MPQVHGKISADQMLLNLGWDTGGHRMGFKSRRPKQITLTVLASSKLLQYKHFAYSDTQKIILLLRVVEKNIYIYIYTCKIK